MRASPIVLVLLLAGCASPRIEKSAEEKGYARGYGQAVKEQYWIIQNQQRRGSAAADPKQP
ncbi:MAG: hypothetical protein JWM32_1270 [Verrucomicrobia bacterium]|nr:hypothetical protein [Verrucomicrobiota bacterium]